ncbi:MAG: hypothetical protein C4548_03935 [Desulfobacteraceae bacterium]|jgi:hypothetical protein|nr:MAG: hypothetical protein C4548_03935 [Desulfobacteraceae bacterium]
MDNNIFEEMVRSWGSPIVPRQQVGKFSGGVLNPRTMANLDCLGVGPKNRFRIGSKVVYRTKDLAEWLAKRSSVN